MPARAWFSKASKRAGAEAGDMLVEGMEGVKVEEKKRWGRHAAAAAVHAAPCRMQMDPQPSTCQGSKHAPACTPAAGGQEWGGGDLRFTEAVRQSQSTDDPCPLEFHPSSSAEELPL
eukprot:87522-Chlamydomonas_euryale.AAC.1